MSMKIINGYGTVHTLLQALNDEGAFKRFEIYNNGDYDIAEGWLSDKVFFRSGLPIGGNPWMDVKYASPELTIPMYNGPSKGDTSYVNYKIIVFDTGYLFGIQKNPGTSYTPMMMNFIGKTVDENGVESMGAFCALYEDYDTFAVMTDSEPMSIEKKDVPIAIKSMYNTKISQVCSTQSRAKFVDIFTIEQSPYTGATGHAAERAFCLNGEYFYSCYYGRAAIRFGGI